MIRLKLLMPAAGTLMLMSCSSPDTILKPDQVARPDTGKHLIATTAANRHTVISRKDSTSYICTEPPPDVGTSADLYFDLGISLLNFGGSDRTDEKQDVDQEGLGGRSANVLIVRDILYRTCELLINSNLSDDQKLSLFRDVLKTVERIGVAKIAVGTTPGVRAAVSLPGSPAAGDGADKKDSSSPPDECGTSPGGSECADYCSSNSDNPVCKAVCTLSDSDTDTYRWCTAE